MKRRDAIEKIIELIDDELIVCNIGFPSRELYDISDREENFYMIGSMGLASSIGLGLALSKPERNIVAETIREKLLRTLDEEIPHGTAVTIEEWKEKRGVVSIRAEIYCEKASHKGIIIGKRGALIKQIGMQAREDAERMLDAKVFLDLYVRVKENWRDSDFNVTNFGYNEDN